MESYVHGEQSLMDGISIETKLPCRQQSVAPVIPVCSRFPILRVHWNGISYQGIFNGIIGRICRVESQFNSMNGYEFRRCTSSVEFRDGDQTRICLSLPPVYSSWGTLQNFEATHHLFHQWIFQIQLNQPKGRSLWLMNAEKRRGKWPYLIWEIIPATVHTFIVAAECQGCLPCPHIKCLKVQEVN